MEYHLFVQLSLVLALAAGISVVMRLFKQPLIMGYILTGILAGPSLFSVIQDHHAFESFSEIGIALLLFIVGLGLSVTVIKGLGKVALLTATLILSVVGTLGFLVATAFGFTGPEAWIMAVALFFSSTIIILKVLSDKKELSRLYGQIAIGVILVDDLVATLALVVVAALGTSGTLSVAEIGWLVAKGLALGALLVLAATQILPRMSKFFANSQELLFLFSIAWGFGIASLFDLIGLSMEVGALFAGVSMASLPYATEMATRLKPLRDFFVIIFFIFLGSTFNFGGITDNLVPALVLSAIVVLLKPVVVMASLGLLGYTKRTSFKAGIHLSQISEFSIILAVFAFSTGLVSESFTTLVTLVALITIAISTYLMKYDDVLYKLWEKPLRFFEHHNAHDKSNRAMHIPLILFGYQKGGQEFVKTFRQLKKRYVVVDYDPDVIEHMERQGIRHMFGDATDPELLEEIGVHRADLVVSTITSLETNLLLGRHVTQWNPDGIFICHANSYDDADKLYEHGATYVMLPHHTGSQRLNSFLRQNGSNRESIERHRKQQFVRLGRVAVK